MMAVVLARGAGRRMRAPAAAALSDAQRAAADGGLKVAMPVGTGSGQPFLDFALSALADAGCTDACLVVPPEYEAWRQRYAPARCLRLRVQFAPQEAPTGTAAAVCAAASAVGDRPFLVVNGDNLYPPHALEQLVALEGCGLAAFTRASLVNQSGFDLNRVARFALVDSDEHGWLTGLREKLPLDDLAARAPEALISMNAWRFDRTVLDACCAVAPSPRGEYELPDAVMLAVARGTPLRVLTASGAVLDLTGRDDVAVVSQRLADREPRL
ncbi:MAG: sugar phosphate nucleotidyltransferase [Acidobacteriota bacterium]